MIQLFDIIGERRDGRVGIWVENNGVDRKIAALGVRIRRGVAYHGIAINICPDLSHFSGIVPCGLHQFGVTSFEQEGRFVARADLISAMQTVLPIWFR